MRPFSKRCQAEFKANSVQRKSDLIFTQSSLNVIMPKSSWLAPHPLRCSRRRAFGSLKTLFNPSRRISHHLCCGSLPFAFAGSSSPWEWSFIQSVSLFLSLHASPAHSLILEPTVLGLWSTARCFKRHWIKYIWASVASHCVFDIKYINHCVGAGGFRKG